MVTRRINRAQDEAGASVHETGVGPQRHLEGGVR